MNKQSTKFSCFFITLALMLITWSCSNLKEHELSLSKLEITQLETTNVDSLGVIWVITIDNSTSMLTTNLGWRKQAIADFIANKIRNENLLENANFDKDYFMFFHSGACYQESFNASNIPHQLEKLDNLDESFIHPYNSTIVSFECMDMLLEEIKSMILKNDYKYRMSFPSQISVYSVLKAVQTIKEKNLTANFKNMRIVVITDDGDQNDQWQQDYRTLKKNNPQVLINTLDVNSRYIYNHYKFQDTHQGFGELKEIANTQLSNDNIPHIWIYDYTTKQSISENADPIKYFAIEAFDGKNLTLNALVNKYKDDSILFFRLDTVIINNKKHFIGERFGDRLHIPIDSTYENGFDKNKFIVKGSFQVQYTDSIWGDHYKKYFYEQTEELGTAYRTAKINKAKNTAIILFALVILWIAVILPNRKLFVFYDNQGRKFIVKRGWKWQWKSGNIPILSYVFDEKTSEVIHKKSTRIKQEEHHLGNTNDDEFLIVSRYKITIPSTVLLAESDTKQDIESLYKSQSAKYKPLWKNIYHKTLQYNVGERLRNANIAREMLLFLLNIFPPKRYYVVKKQGNNSNIRFTFPKWKSKTFVVEIANKTNRYLSDGFKMLNTQCMNDYYEENYLAKSFIGVGEDHGWIYWTVLQPEFVKDHQQSLKYAYNIFQFKQKRNGKTANQIPQNIEILKRTVKAQTGRYQRVICRHYGVLENNTNKYNFEIVEAMCPGFLYLQEENDKKDKSLIFSPFKDGLLTEKLVRVPKTTGSHLYLSFTMPTYLKGLDSKETLWKKLNQRNGDDVSFDYKRKDFKYIQIRSTDILIDGKNVSIQ